MVKKSVKTSDLDANMAERGRAEKRSSTTIQRIEFDVLNAVWDGEMVVGKKGMAVSRTAGTSVACDSSRRIKNNAAYFVSVFVVNSLSRTSNKAGRNAYEQFSKSTSSSGWCVSRERKGNGRKKGGVRRCQALSLSPRRNIYSINIFLTFLISFALPVSGKTK